VGQELSCLVWVISAVALQEVPPPNRTTEPRGNGTGETPATD